MHEESMFHFTIVPPLPKPELADMPEGLDLLTPKERQVVTCVSQGMTNKEAARAMDGMSPHTVATHLRRAFVKLQINSRDQLAQVLLGSG